MLQRSTSVEVDESPKPGMSRSRGRMSVFTDEMPSDLAHILEQQAKEAAAPAEEPPSSARKGKGGPATSIVAEQSASESREAAKRRELAQVEAKVYALATELNLLSFKAEEKQQALERMSETEQVLRMAPMSPEFARKKAGSSKASSPAAAPAPSGPVAPAAAPSSALLDDSSAIYKEATLSQILGNNHPTVALEHARLAVEGRLVSVEPELLEAEEYGETLTMMLFRLKQEHARQLAAIGEMRDRGIELDGEEHELRLHANEARGAAGVARLACKETKGHQAKNANLYETKIRERKAELELAEKRAAKQDRLQAKIGGPAAAAGGKPGGGMRRGSSKAGGGAVEDEKMQRLQRSLIATRMSSLVLMAQRDDNVEQVSRYEAAFKKMARAAGSNDAEVVIAKFMARNETRAGLLEERSQTARRRQSLDSEHQKLASKLSEMQYSMVHPAQTETALRRLDPKLTKASGKVELLNSHLHRLRDLQIAAGTGCAALLTRIASSVPALGPPPDNDLNLDKPTSPEKETGGASGVAPPGALKRRNSQQGMQVSAEGGEDGSKEKEGAAASEAKVVQVLAAAEKEGNDGDESRTTAFDEKLLAMFKVCEQRLERLCTHIEAKQTRLHHQEVQKGGADGDTPELFRRGRRGSFTGSIDMSKVDEEGGSAPLPPPQRPGGRERSSSIVSLSGNAPTPPMMHRRGSGAGLNRPGSARGEGVPGVGEGATLPNGYVDAATALNIRIQPADVEPPRVVGLDTYLIARAPATATPQVTPKDNKPRRIGGGSAAGSGVSAASALAPPMTILQPEDADDPAEDAERMGFFGEERRRVKVGERPGSARKPASGGGLQPVPPSGPRDGSSSARPARGSGSRKASTGGRPMTSR